ncbi:MAG: DNA polymerase I [Muribaculaceae bacterium]|nr:DNA polymerase I [Muribaculaceae bacterium]
MDDKKLFLLDAYALIYRAYYALIRAPRITSTGFNTSAVFGFCNTLDELLRKENPSHIAVCFDPHGPTFRHEVYPEYKAKREAQPEDITLSVPVIKEIVEAYRIPVFEVPGYEADDVIGTLSRMASEQGFTTYMMTPDKDYGQLVSHNVFMYKPPMRGQDGEIRGPQEICARYGIDTPAQVIDLLALEGDAVDNIPGCPGVGPKTASKLIKEFGSVENLLANAASVKGALGKKLQDNADNIRFSKDLATIRRDVPLAVDFNTLRREPEDVERLRDIFTRMEFKTFLGRLRKSAPSGDASAESAVKSTESREANACQPSLFDFIEGETAAGVPAAGDPDGAATEVFATLRAEGYGELTGDEAISKAVSQACDSPVTGVALYAIGAEAMTADLRAVAFSSAEGEAAYIALPADAAGRKRVLELLSPMFASGNCVIVSHDIKRDMVLLRRENVEFTARYFDTSLAHYVLQPEMRHRQADIAASLLRYHTMDYAEASSSRKPYGPLPAATEMERLCEQADITRRLYAPLRELLEANRQENLVNDIELPLARVLADMEWTGVRIDSAELHRLSVQLTALLRSVEEQAYEAAGERFNISSPLQVGEILFGKLKLDPKAKRTKTGAFSTTEEILEKHRADHPVVGLILEARGLKKLLSTYINALPALVNPATGKIHTTYNQTITATGRISSANPNLQNIPIRTEDGRDVRRAFIADPGCLILSADYSQIELRLLAALSNDPELTEAFRAGLDIHRATAAKIYHVPFDEVTDDQRRKAKTANFGTVYGISAFGLSERLGIPRSEAKELIEGYFRTYPHIREYIAGAVEKAHKDGYVTTIMGRTRFLPDINSRNATVRSYAERNAVNAPLQGSAADIIKIAMIRIHEEMMRLGLRSRMVMQVHDELVFNVVPEELPQLQEMVSRRMSGAFSGTVPLEVSSGVGANWLEAH